MMKWKGDKKLLISGKSTEIDIVVDKESCVVEFVNKSPYPNKAPKFEMFKADADRQKTLEDYLRSLNPALAAIIQQSLN